MLKRNIRNILRAVVQQYAPKFAKKKLWNHEFSSGRWDCLDRLGDDRGHAQIEKYAAKGHILDLGCGSGTTSVELNDKSYSSYTGVDISDVAVQKAKARAQEAGRADRNEYYQSDIFAYMPPRLYDVILFGDSIYYVPYNQIHALLKKYEASLAKDGVFLVRMHDASGKHARIVEVIERNFEMVDKISGAGNTSTACILVFRPVSTEERKSSSKSVTAGKL